MDPTRIGLFALAERRLAWSEQRQALLARNVANLSTPSFQPRDVQPFARTLSRLTAAGPLRTDPHHLGGTQADALRASAATRPTARSPDGNAVTLDEQLTKIADTETGQALVTTIYKKYVGMFAMALGRTQ